MAFCPQFQLRDDLHYYISQALPFSLGWSVKPSARLRRYIAAFGAKFATNWMAMTNSALMFVLSCHTIDARFTLHQHVAVKLGKTLFVIGFLVFM